MKPKRPLPPKVALIILAASILPFASWFLLSKSKTESPVLVAAESVNHLTSGVTRQVPAPPVPSELTHTSGPNTFRAASGPGAPTDPAARPPASTIPPSTRLDSSLTDVDQTEALIAELTRLGEGADPSTLPQVLSALSHDIREVRQAALEASVQLGDREVIPTLQELADGTEDPREQAEILVAIDYLSLPTLTEWRAAKRNR